MRANPDVVLPTNRKNAPIHIVSRASVSALTERLGSDGEEDLSQRFRPNIVIDGDIEPFVEQRWETLRLGSATLKIIRPTLRCPIPGLDPRTGRNIGDIPKLYRDMDKLPNDQGIPKAVFGVYAVPELNESTVQLKQRVEVEVLHA